ERPRLIYTSATYQSCSRCFAKPGPESVNSGIRLAAYAGGSALVYLLAFTLPYSLPSDLQQPLHHFLPLSDPCCGATPVLIPSLDPPSPTAHASVFPYTRRGHSTLPWGPTWPSIIAAPALVGGGVLVSTRVAFKGLAALGYVLCVPAVDLAAPRLHRRRSVTA